MHWKLAQSPETPTVTLQEQAAAVFFDDVRFRPEPRSVAELIKNGLTEEVITIAALSKEMQRPTMEATLGDLDACLPYYQRINDHLSRGRANTTLLFAGRDAEVLYDDFAIRYPQEPSYLLPASGRLWRDYSMDDQHLATSFFEQYSLTKAAVRRRQNRYTVVDSGFRGTIGEQLDDRLCSLYGVSLRQADRLDIKLVSAGDGAIGKQIMGRAELDPSDLHVAGHARLLNEKTRQLGEGFFPLAVSMQLMPRYHGHYNNLQTEDDKTVAIPATDEQARDNVDTQAIWVNSSIVNPVAAAITQFRVVDAALGNSSPTTR